jgi:hypothetical protein
MRLAGCLSEAHTSGEAQTLEARGVSVTHSTMRSSAWIAAELRHPTGRERTGSPTLQTLQDPILLLRWALTASSVVGR